MTAPSPRVASFLLGEWGRRALQWSVAALVGIGALAFLSNQLFLGHRASGKSVEWMQAAAWAIPTLLAWCACLPVVIKLATRRPVSTPIQVATLGVHFVAGSAVCVLLLGLHLTISWLLGWIPRDISILPFEFVMTGRAYGGLNFIAYWCIVVWITVKRARPHDLTAPGPGHFGIHPFVVKVGSRRVLVPVSDVRWIEAAGNYVRLHTADGVHLVRMSLKTVAARLDPHDFVRIHRSVIVRQSAVRALKPRAAGDYDVTLTDGAMVTLSRRFRPEALRRLTDSS